MLCSQLRACLILLLSCVFVLSSGGAEVEVLTPEIIGAYPFDASCYTQGLELHDGLLYVSSGLYGKSDLRTAKPDDGAIVRRVELPKQCFAEGITSCPAGLWMLTWRENIAMLFDPATLQLVRDAKYDTEGWGLCYDGSDLIMSDGTARLYRRDPKTFDLRSSVTVTLSGIPQEKLNELEYANGAVYANVYQTNTILRIDPKSGKVTGIINVPELLAPDAARRADVLNGIAYDRKTGHFYITGKLWPYLFEVKFKKQ